MLRNYEGVQGVESRSQAEMAALNLPQLNQDLSTVVKAVHEAQSTNQLIARELREGLRDGLAAPERMVLQVLQDIRATDYAFRSMPICHVQVRNLAEIAEARMDRNFGHAAAAGPAWELRVTRLGKEQQDITVPESTIRTLGFSSPKALLRALSLSAGVAVWRQNDPCFDVINQRDLREDCKSAYDAVFAQVGESVVEMVAKKHAVNTAALQAREMELVALYQERSPSAEFHAALQEDAAKDAAFLERVINLYDRRVSPEMGRVDFSDGRTDLRYGLMIDRELVLRREADGTYCAIGTDLKKNPFKLVPVAVHPVHEQRALLRADFGMGDYCTASGVPLKGPARELASNLFNIVSRSVRVFPEDNAHEVLRKVAESDERAAARLRKAQDVAPRHWGQEYLQSLNPEQVIPGELFVDGEHWKIYVFGEVVVAESDKTDSATFVGKREAIDLFRSCSRAEITALHDGELLGRIIHRGQEEEARQAWRAAVDSHLAAHIAKQSQDIARR